MLYCSRTIRRGFTPESLCSIKVAVVVYFSFDMLQMITLTKINFWLLKRFVLTLMSWRRGAIVVAEDLILRADNTGPDYKGQIIDQYR